jgi:hypothetical protein
MPILAGQIVTAAQLNRLQPKSYRAVGSTTLSGAVTNADVPGASVTFTTETTDAVYVAHASFDPRIYQNTQSGLNAGNIMVDGVIGNEYAIFRDGGGSTGTAMSVSQTYRGTLGAAGSHTIKLVANLLANVQLNVYASLTVTIYEVV